MNKIDYNANSQQPTNVRPLFKLTYPFLILMIAIIACFIFNLQNVLSMQYVKMENYQVWRLITSFLASNSYFDFAMNLSSAMTLTFLSERINGSNYYVLDFLIKNFLVNLFSLFLYIICMCCSIVFQSVFVDLMEVQLSQPISGLLPLVVMETVFVFLNFIGEGDQWTKSNFNKLTLVPLLFTLGYTLFYFYNFIWVYASVLVALIFRIKWLDYGSLIDNSHFSRLFGKLSNKSMMYPSQQEQSAMDFYETNESISFAIKKSQGSTEESTETEKIEKAGEPQEPEVSRYENVNVNDYILENKNEQNEFKPDESFEI